MFIDMPTEKEILYNKALDVVRICGFLPASGKLYGFNVRDLIWGQIAKLTDAQANLALKRLKE